MFQSEGVAFGTDVYELCATLCFFDKNKDLAS